MAFSALSQRHGELDALCLDLLAVLILDTLSLSALPTPVDAGTAGT
jgi:hypothetical protein